MANVTRLRNPTYFDKPPSPYQSREARRCFRHDSFVETSASLLLKSALDAANEIGAWTIAIAPPGCGKTLVAVRECQKRRQTYLLSGSRCDGSKAAAFRVILEAMGEDHSVMATAVLFERCRRMMQEQQPLFIVDEAEQVSAAAFNAFWGLQEAVRTPDYWGDHGECNFSFFASHSILTSLRRGGKLDFLHGRFAEVIRLDGLEADDVCPLLDHYSVRDPAIRSFLCDAVVKRGLTLRNIRMICHGAFEAADREARPPALEDYVLQWQSITNLAFEG